MIEINFNREEATLIIENHGNEDFTFLHVDYSDGKMKEGFEGKLQLSKMIKDHLIHFDFPLEVEILAQQGNMMKHYTLLNNPLTLVEVKEKPLEELIKWTLAETNSLHPPINSFLQENRLFKEFIDLICAYADTKYRELDNKRTFHKFLQSKYPIRLDDSGQSNARLSKCVALIELLTLTQEEMTELLFNFLRLKNSVNTCIPNKLKQI